MENHPAALSQAARSAFEATVHILRCNTAQCRALMESGDPGRLLATCQALRKEVEAATVLLNAKGASSQSREWLVQMGFSLAQMQVQLSAIERHLLSRSAGEAGPISIRVVRH